MNEPRHDEIKSFITQLSEDFTPNEAITENQLTRNHAQVHGGAWHYTVVAKLPGAMSAKIAAFSQQLYEVDETLIQYDPELYHLTLCWFGANYDVDEQIKFIKQNLTSALSFTIADVMIAPYGIGIKAWPSNRSLATVRQAVYGSTGRTIPDLEATMDGSVETFLTSWVSIARFGPKPKEASQKFITQHMDELFGSFTPEEFLVYKVNNKYLQNAELVAKIQNEGGIK